MDQICIAKKITVDQNVELLDFALDDNENLMLFPNFQEASTFLQNAVGKGEQLLNFIITTLEAQANNVRMQELLAKLQTKVSDVPQESVSSLELQYEKEEVELTFLLDCSDYEIVNNEAIGDKLKKRLLAPVLVFVDVSDPTQPVQVPNLVLKGCFIDKI